MALTPPAELKELEKELERVIREKDMYLEAQEFEKAASLRDKERRLTNKKRELEEQWEAGEGEGERRAIGEEEIADIVSMWTGIPVFKLTEAETQKLMRMEEELHKRVIGQDAAVDVISKAIRRSRLIGRRFRIVHALFHDEVVEVSTYRAPSPPETEDPRDRVVDEHGRLVRDNVWGNGDQDAARRDFTVNATY